MRKILKAGLFVALFQVCCVSLPAQSLGDVLKKVASSSSVVETATDYVASLLGVSEVTAEDLVGTWTYSEPVLVLESDQILSKLGGTVAASTIEEKMASVLEKIGLSEGDVKLTFESGGKYACEFNGHSISGTYEVSDATLTLKKLNYTTLSANVKKTGSTLQLAVEADKLLTLVSSITSLAPSSSTLSTVTSLLNNYDGLQLGMKFTK